MRLSSILLSTALIVASGASWAQSPAPDAPPPPPAATTTGEAPPPPPPGDMPPPPHPMMGGHGPRDKAGPDTGFHVRMGEDRELKVECGEMPLAECITAAQPLLDMAGN